MSRFDRVMLSVLLGLTLVAGLLIWQGQQSPLQTLTVTPDSFRVLYLAPNSEGRDQLFATTLHSAETVQLTQELFGVWDYAASPDAKMIVYSALREDGGTDLLALPINGRGRHELLACPEERCIGISWAPDSRRLVYTRRRFTGPPRLWWLDAVSGETVPVFQADDVLGYAARWSPDGQWLTYVSPRDGVQIYNVHDGRNLLLSSQMSEPAAWSPQSEALLIADVQVVEEHSTVQLLRMNLETGEVTNLSAGQPVDDDKPAWSPEGEWIAFRRKLSEAEAGEQIWLMRADGSAAHAMTEEPKVRHGAPAWSPDGRHLIFERSLSEVGSRSAAIWAYEIESGKLWMIVGLGNLPSWLP